MMSFIRELPFVDTLAPLLIAAGIWTGAHIFVIGPDIVAPRLAEKYYLPTCRAGLQKALVNARNRQQERDENLIREKRAKLEEMNALSGALLRQFFGRDLGGRLGNSPVFNPMNALQPDVIDRLITQSIPASNSSLVSKSGYCACVISEVLRERVSTGLFSASMRIWKPDNIRLLESLETGPVSTPRCPAPKFSDTS